jgi:hypothetical protein
MPATWFTIVIAVRGTGTVARRTPAAAAISESRRASGILIKMVIIASFGSRV